jgi:hypothetical protein
MGRRCPIDKDGWRVGYVPDSAVPCMCARSGLFHRTAFTPSPFRELRQDANDLSLVSILLIALTGVSVAASAGGVTRRRIAWI